MRTLPVLVDLPDECLVQVLQKITRLRCVAGSHNHLRRIVIDQLSTHVHVVVGGRNYVNPSIGTANSLATDGLE